MKAPVTHINLLQRSAPAHTVALSLAVLLAVTVMGLVYYGSQLRAQAREATRQRDEVAQQLKNVQARMAIQNGEQAKSAQAIVLRKELDALQPQSQVAQALVDAVRVAQGGRADEFARALTAMTGLNEPGLWLSTLTLSAGGKRLELQGEASTGASVLRYARRANESLQPQALRLDSLEVQTAAAAAAAASGAGASTVSFRLY
jgi:hypothetical protein